MGSIPQTLHVCMPQPPMGDIAATKAAEPSNRHAKWHAKFLEVCMFACPLAERTHLTCSASLVALWHRHNKNSQRTKIEPQAVIVGLDHFLFRMLLCKSIGHLRAAMDCAIARCHSALGRDVCQLIRRYAAVPFKDEINAVAQGIKLRGCSSQARASTVVLFHLCRKTGRLKRVKKTN